MSLADELRQLLGAEAVSDDAVELLTRQIVSTKRMKLEPMEPVLLRVERK